MAGCLAIAEAGCVSAGTTQPYIYSLPVSLYTQLAGGAVLCIYKGIESWYLITVLLPFLRILPHSL